MTDSKALECRMRITKTFAMARTQHEGETYYFCVEECRNKFAEDPRRYVASTKSPVCH